MERIYSADDLQLLYIGRQTDNDLPKRYIDVGPYVEMYPSAHFDIVVFRPDEDVSYFADAALEGRTLIWTIHDGDVAVPGRGRAHIIISEGEGRHNLHDFITEIGETEQAEMVEVPDPAEGWVKRVIDAKNAANTAANAALQAVISADQSAQDAADALNELKDRIESGEFKGEPGEPGKDGTTPVKGVDYFTAEEQDEFKRAVTPVKGVDYRDGRDGIDGKDGLNGRDGRDGIDATPYDDTEIRNAVAEIKDDIAKQEKRIE